MQQFSQQCRLKMVFHLFYSLPLLFLSFVFNLKKVVLSFHFKIRVLVFYKMQIILCCRD